MKEEKEGSIHFTVFFINHEPLLGSIAVSDHRLLPDSFSGRSSSWYHLDYRQAGRPCPGASPDWWCDPEARFPTKSSPSACPKTESFCRNDRKWCWSLREEIIRSIKYCRYKIFNRVYQFFFLNGVNVISIHDCRSCMKIIDHKKIVQPQAF